MLFSQHYREEKLTKISDILNKLNEVVNWESFRPTLESFYPKQEKSKPGRRRTDPVLMFKIFVLQRYYDLSDDAVEYQILDRLSFMKFLGLTLEDPVPDAKTIWRWRNEMMQAGLIDKLFRKLVRKLRSKGIIFTGGKIVDASIMKTAKGKGEADDEDDDDINENSERQTDRDSAYDGHKKENGYKNHIKMDQQSKMIENFEVSPANEHDSQYLEDLLEEGDEEIYADKAYDSEKIRQALKKRGIKNKIMKKAQRGKKQFGEFRKYNKSLSSIRSGVEHVFGWIKRQRKKFQVRARSLARATAEITLQNITYNLFNLIRLGKSI